MPSKSQKQRRYLEAQFGHTWVKAHHFDKVVPARSGSRLTKKKKGT